MPKLKLRYRILLYISMVLFSSLALFQVATGAFAETAGLLIYVLAAATLFSGTYYLIQDCRKGIGSTIKPAVSRNRYITRLAADYRLRTILLTVPGLALNILFAAVNTVAGIVSRSAWFGSMAVYFLMLGIMRIEAVRKEKQISNIDDPVLRHREEVLVYRKNSIFFIFMAIVLAGMVVLLETSQGGSEYPGYMIYVVAMYVFYKIIEASISVLKVSKRNSPLLTIIERIDYAEACVSILILQTAMFAAFGNGEETFIKTMNGITGTLVWMMIIFLGVQGVYTSRTNGSIYKTGGKNDKNSRGRR